MTELTYRKAVLGDLPAICALGQEVNLMHYEALPGIFIPPTEPATESHWREGIEGEHTATFVAELAGLAIGFLTLHVGREDRSLLHPVCFAHVDSVCVTHEHRGKGVGSKLMAMAENWAVSSGAIEVRLNVWKFNASAVRLYEELGYEVRSLHMGKSLVTPRA